MNIGIIGYGVVGKACRDGFVLVGHDVTIHDIKLKTSVEDLLITDILFICVPSPIGNDNSCDTSIVESCIKALKDISYEGAICIKSTVEPGTTVALSEKYEMEISFVPEFLRERCATQDFIENHDLLALGTSNKSHELLIIEAHGNLPKQVKMLNQTEAEFLKYFSNTYNALKIIFANNIYELTQQLDADYSKVLDAYLSRELDKGDYLMVSSDLRGYGGVCLPKDVKALAALAKKLNSNLNLFSAIDEDNQRIKTTVFNGMREE